MPIETEQLEYWGEQFTRHGIDRYITFDAFMVNPQKNWDEIMTGRYRPLTVEERVERNRKRAQSVGSGLDNALDRLEREIEHMRRIDNGHPYEQLKHHANGR